MHNISGMKRTLLFSFLIIGILSINGCKKDPPVAQFSTDKTTYKEGQTITFVNQSTNAETYLWAFGDGKTSTNGSPTHSYASAGDFTVKLTVSNSAGTDSISKILPILPDLSGLWYETISGGGGMGGFNNLTGDMNITQHDDNTLTGSFGYSGGGGGSRTANLSSTSVINGHDVTINWDSPAYKFKGTVNAAGTSMSGTFTSNNGGAGTWSARKL